MIKTYKEIEYIVYWFEEIGSFNGYVKLPENHKFQKFIDEKKEIFGKELSMGYDKMGIDVHGGLTFSDRITEKNQKDFPQGFSLGSWIGWDYAHYGDKLMKKKKFSVKNFQWAMIKWVLMKFLDSGKQWTEEEVEQECKKVIDQLLEQ